MKGLGLFFIGLKKQSLNRHTNESSRKLRPKFDLERYAIQNQRIKKAQYPKSTAPLIN
jgi:hypothetical protein